MTQQLTKIKCDICNSRGVSYITDKNFSILQCKKCNLIWTNPLTSIKEPSKTYWFKDIYQNCEKEQKKRFRKQLKLFFKKTQINLEKLHILEIGSGLGFLLDVCDEFKIISEGCDISPIAVNLANKKRDRVRLGSIGNYYKNESFDTIFAFNLIEHLLSPKLFLQQAFRILKTNGYLVLETPIKESLFHKLAEIANYSFNINYTGLTPGGHVYKFSKKTFKFLNKQWKIIYIKNIPSPFKEMWQKSKIANFKSRTLYKLILPAAWLLSKLTFTGNRIFVILQKKG